MDVLRPNWKIRTPSGATLTVEYDTLRHRWRVDPGGYERRRLADALAQATSSSRDDAWLIQLADRLEKEPKHERGGDDQPPLVPRSTAFTPRVTK